MTRTFRNVTIAHPLQQHSYHLAEAIESTGALLRYYTTVYYKGERPIYRILDRCLPTDAANRMHGRTNAAIEPRVRAFHTVLGVVYLLAIRIDHNKIAEPILYQLLVRLFGRRVAKDLRHDSSASCLVMYDTTAYECFRQMHRYRPDILRILDMSSAPAELIRETLIQELAMREPFRQSVRVKLRSYTERRCRRYMHELALAHHILVPSTFVLESLVAVGVPREKLTLCPYGVDFRSTSIAERRRPVGTRPMRFLFVGRVEAAKGIHHLLEAFSRFDPNLCSLTVVGSIECHPEDLDKYRSSVTFTGPLGREGVLAAYGAADVYVMPSLFEGLSLTILEAMSAGLPVIASTRSAGADLITDGVEGFVVEAGSSTALTETVSWALDHPEDMALMGHRAALVARNFTWGHYSRRVKTAFEAFTASGRGGEPHERP